MSNCLFAVLPLWVKLGGELVGVHTTREYMWKIKFPHFFLRLPNGYEIEYAPTKKTLGKLPPPLFKGHYRIRNKNG